MAGMDVMESPNSLSGQNAQLDTTPSASAPDYRPAVPKPQVTIFPKLLPWNFIFTLIPFLPRTLGSTASYVPHPASKDAIPPWTFWLERWFRTFHPSTWSHLEMDENADQRYMWEINALYVRAQHARQFSSRDDVAVALPTEEYLAKLASDCAIVSKRSAKRHLHIYGLYHLRKLFISRQRELYPNLSEHELIALAPLGQTNQLPAVSDGSVWPFDFPAPPRCTCKCAPPNPCSCAPASPSPQHFVYPSAKPPPSTFSHTRSLSDTLLKTFFSLPQAPPQKKPSNKPDFQRFALPYQNELGAYEALAQLIPNTQRGEQGSAGGTDKVKILGATIEVSSTAVKLAAHGATATEMTHRPRVQAV